MARVSIRQLQQQLREVLSRVERGEAVEVTKRRRLVARLLRAQETPAPDPWPDLDARAQAVFGRRVISPSASLQLLEDRGDR